MPLDPALNVPCPTCRVKAGQPCRSYRDISVHRDRRQAAAGGQEPRRPARQQAAEPATALIGHTGPERPIPETVEWWPPWEEPPVPGCLAESGIPVTGLVWCPVHRDYEELTDGAPAARLAPTLIPE